MEKMKGKEGVSEREKDREKEKEKEESKAWPASPSFLF